MLAKQDLPPEAERALREFFDQYSGTIDPLREDLVDAVEAGAIDPSSTESIRVEVRRLAGNYTNDVQIVYRDGVERGAEAGRAIAGRRYPIDVSFDVVPTPVLNELDSWADEMTGEVLDTITEDTTQFIRAAHEEGLAIPDIAEAINDDLFDGRLQDWQAERTARTATLSSSNAGSHSAFGDADSVVGEEWLATADDRTRDTHGTADGQIVAVGNTFLVGGYEARYPGDPRLPVGEVVNCRCTVVPVFRSDLSDSQFAQLESGGRLNASAPITTAAT
jgi:hypothetical protein